MAKVVLQQNSMKKDTMQFLSGKNTWCYTVVTTSVMLIVYFILSIGLTFYQRWLLQKYHFPLSVVVCHLIIKFCCASIFRQIWQCVYERRRVSVDIKNHVFKIAPIGFASGLDIGFSNWGIEHITVSLYVMTKSTTIIFILGFALLFSLEKKSWHIVVIVAMISGGLGMFTYKATQFDLFGFLLVLFASFSSGLRWTLTQFVMQKAELGLRHPMDMLYHVQPWMMISVLPLALVVEGGDLIADFEKRSWPALSHSLSLVVGGAFIALAMELSEYLVVSQTSSLTLSIAGIFKEVCTLILAVEWNGDQLTLINCVGLLFCLGGIICHVVNKAISSAAQHKPTTLHKPLLDQAAQFLAEDTSSEDESRQEDSSTEVLFSVLNSRNR
ncbi:solute carrier family 35 member C2 [Macrosteles quadrilineatus]|uniref:solute carrier family 35 member C2 n=1 Tax=Macrosteles quadrilineatus TaxID=74068 RepID=UPI0023E1A21F|nr:solute carrier family 35 member C2 [Macrosteles quadrilineatus]